MATKLLSLIGDCVNNINDSAVTLEQVSKMFNIEEAYGIHLDNLNILIDGVVRNYTGGTPNYTDAELRSRINAKIEINNNAGTIFGVVRAVQYYLMLKDDLKWEVVKDSKVGITTSGNDLVVEISDTSLVNIDKLREIQRFIGSGIGLYVVRAYTDNTFTIYEGSGSQVSTLLGLSSIANPTVGGKLADIILELKGSN